MLSVLVSHAEDKAASNNQYRPENNSNGLNVFKPPLLGVAINDLLDDVIKNNEKTFFDKNRKGIALVILLCHQMGLVGENEINMAVDSGWRDIYHLFGRARELIARHLDGIARGIAKTECNEDFEFVHMELVGNDKEEFSLNLICNLRFSQLDIASLDADLGRMVYGCIIWLIREIGFGITTGDLLYQGYIGEEIDSFNELRKRHGIIDVEKMVNIINEEEIYPFFEIIEDEESLLERLVFIESIIDQSEESSFGSPMEMDRIREKFVRWRCDDKERLKQPWAIFIGQCLKTCKSVKLNNNMKTIRECGDSDVGDIPLDYGHAIGFGFAWEEEVVESVYQGIYEGGETPTSIINLNTIALPDISETLCLLASARGLIRLAENINFK